MFTEQLRRKHGLSIVLYLDIKNAFNVVNHRAVYHVLEAKSFHEADITLFRLNSAWVCPKALHPALWSLEQ